MVLCTSMEHLKGLNEAQKKAVLATNGAVLVLAGAGAGKTKTIAHRIAHIVNSGTPGHAILAITFTNKAAREMRERAVTMLQTHNLAHTGRPTVSTFHALSAELLREHADLMGLSRHFTIFDRSDSLKAVKKALKEAGEDDKRFEPRSVLGAISRAKGEAVGEVEYEAQAGNGYFERIVADVWPRYSAILRKEKSLDFDDLLLYTYRLLKEHDAVRAKLNDRWRYVHVDEYQDTNIVQFEIARMLSEGHGNLFGVGDLDQMVYSWRGASIRNILDFESHFPDATILKLEENYRSTKTIIAVSNEIIKKNKKRREKTLFTNNEDGEKILCLCGYDEHAEAGLIVNTVDDLLSEGTPAREIAILYRANFQSRVLEEAFLSAGLPYRVLGTRFFDRAEVKDTLSYLRASLNPESESDIRRIINVPARGIGKVTVDKVFSGARDTLPAATAEKVSAFYRMLDGIRGKATTAPVSETLAHILTVSGIAGMLASGHEEDQERLENVRELVSLATTRYDHLPVPEGCERLLEDAALATDQDELDAPKKDGNAVSLMTVHASKGLEFDHVFVSGLEDGLFPHESLGGGRDFSDPEEERRLFYVALTRARKRVYLSYAQSRMVFGNRAPRLPSEFLLEIDEAYLEADIPPEPRPGKVVYLE